MVVSQSKGLGLHSKYSEKALQCSHRGWLGLTSVFAAWRLDGRRARVDAGGA